MIIKLNQNSINSFKIPIEIKLKKIEKAHMSRALKKMKH